MQFVCKYSDVFSESNINMRLRHVFLTFLLVISCLAASAAPARRGTVILSQPDGTSFKALIRGDEFMKIKTTDSGHAIIQDSEGWWCYAAYDSSGARRSTGFHVGEDVPSDILSTSLQIPYSLLSSQAVIRKEAAFCNTEYAVPVKNFMTKGEGQVKHGLVILAAFDDVGFDHTEEEFERLLNQEGYSVNGATGSAKEYFNDQFDGKVTFDFQVSKIVTLPKKRAFYGENGNDGTDQAPAEMVHDACILADDEIDFSLYDDDNDGVVDNVFIFFAGADEAEGGAEECIWSHAWYVRSGAGISLELDGKQIDRYACSSELTVLYEIDGKTTYQISTIGTFCHEYSHTLGLPDVYDTDYEDSDGMAAGLWNRTSLMDGGNFNNYGNTPPYYNALERMILGLVEPVELKDSGTYTIDPVHKGGSPYMLMSPGGNEFFLFECRERHKWDGEIGGSGMLVYHVDMREESMERWRKNKINADPDHQCVDLIEADGRTDRFSTTDEYQKGLQNIAGIFFPYLEINALNTDGFPALTFWNGTEAEGSIIDIRKTEAAIQFTYLGEDGALIPPTAVNITKEVFASAAIIGFESSYTYDGDATVIWGRSGQEKDTLTVSPYTTGKYAIFLENLESAGKTYEIDIVFRSDIMDGEVRSTSVMTKRMPSVKWPYIHLGNAKRHTDGSFDIGAKIPLIVYGAHDVEMIRWSLDGKEIRRGEDMYYTLEKEGMLKVVIYHSDGSTDIITKEIMIAP